jgi:hypothetical protein
MKTLTPAKVYSDKFLSITDGAIEGDEMIFTVKENCPNMYIVQFDDANVFGERCRILKMGRNVFTRLSGQTGQTMYEVIIVRAETPRWGPIPPRGDGS